jgi:glutamyl-tRNA synthetase
MDPADAQPQRNSGYRGRFAPSPTGSLHPGLARTALLAYLRARSEHGAFILRSEDIDTPRVVAGSLTDILADLRFLGISWDEGPDASGPFAPYEQSRRLDRYEQAIAALRARGLVYPCTCSRKEIALASAPHGPSEFGAPYPGTCRAGPSRPGAPEALRFRVPDELPSFVDALTGQLVAPLAQGDFVLRRADGLYSYHLAVVVDDIAMRVSEVVRGADLAGCTGLQLALYDGLGAPPPSFAHVPLLLGDDGKRLSKRDQSFFSGGGSLSQQGVPADVLVGELLASVGLVPKGTRVMPDEMATRFSWSQLREFAVKTGA